ncbi:family 78 glycoside hydrolase catalytic domain [Microbacterium azadirachtae]|uniref:family 78 glycoside hydrolase catalytic domain n=1 Tax=Microbacterium azadirachtae TaxID=582680 RepID=UPI0008836DE0|nr:family 78 glycoside hydrolase catalytic domain [Microbacterium azadirachtae]SDL83765.1 alpha-L-rhamnosidase [Microbacterium azadirachtae]SEG22984.1 alpha-L-rhamnosidase [Microbacterium azadirachtae]SEG25402.1 alpha-L-rhamnosidase [Microbacterium azadirachtae]
MENPLTHADFLTAEAPREAAIRFRRTIVPEQPREEVVSARLVATALGVYEARLDGAPVSDSVLDPGWNAYEWRLPFQTWDVTDAVRGGSGELSLDVLVGNGWYRGDLGFEGANANYGEQIALALALELVFEDGAVQTVLTDPSWRAETTEVLRNSLYNGETIDARLRGEPGEELAVSTVDVDRSRLIAQAGPPVRRQETLRPVRIWTSPAGRTLVDFGQNLVGWIRASLQGPRGTEIVLRHAEVLEDGELGTRPLRAAKATDVFVLSGGEDVFEPTLTFHGFRYAEVTGWPGELRPEDLEAVVVHSEMRRLGSFECSDPLVTQLVRNSVWGQKGNFLSVPTDCPQRDERLGWTGDIAAYAASASFQFDTSDFLHDWLEDLHAETRHSSAGIVPIVVPDVLKYAHFGDDFAFPALGATAIWGDAAVWVPEALWWAYGDRDRLAAHYPAMVLHLESVERALSPSGLWDEGFQFGDWLDPDAPPENPAAAKADPHVVATACLYRSASFAAEAAEILGKAADAERWRALAERTRTAFQEHYVEDGRVRSDCVTVYALAICFGLLDDVDREKAADRLAELVRAGDYRVTTGFAGTPFVTWALSDTGHVEDAYRLLREKENPSWLYPVTMGATTVWERWDSMLPDGSINPGEMTSFNHYALGAVVDWIHQVVGGVRPAEPGYAKVRIEPVPGPGITWARTRYESAAGEIAAHWSTEDEGFVLDVRIPDGVPAEIVLPGGAAHEVVGGEHRFVA